MTIPASQIVNINPGVLAAGGNPLALNGLYLTENLAMPANTVLGFVNPSAVSKFFGPSSAEYFQSLIYFAGFKNSTLKPNAMLFAPYNAAARAGFLLSGSLANVSLATLQALSGVLTISLDGVPETSSEIVFTGMTQSQMATAIAAAFGTATVTWNPVTSTFQITSTTTGVNSSVSFATGSLSAALNLTSATGALLSPGAVADTPSSAMNNVIGISQNWVSMVPLFEPNLANKELFAAWFTAQNNRYAYLEWDSDVQASVQGATEPFGVVALAQEYDGVACIGGDPLAVPVGSTLAAMVLNVASFVAGAIASINFAQTNGRIALAFQSQGGLVPTCANPQTAQNLLANGYSFYGSYATANQDFVFFYNGQMPGIFEWIDTFVNQVSLNNAMQLALLSLMTSLGGSLPYNPQGYGLVRSALLDPITAALNFGSIRTNVALSAAQISELNLAAGVNAAPIVQSQGYYLQILDPGAQARSNRQTPIVNLWYTDGGAIQNISMDSIDIL